MSNTLKFHISSALYSSSILITSGSIVQGFLLALGVGTAQIGVYTTMVSVTSVTVSMLFSGCADRARRVRERFVFFTSAIALLNLLLLPFCFSSGFSPLVAFAASLLFGIIQTAFMSFRVMFDYKLPFMIFDMSKYDRIIVTNGIAVGASGLAASVAARAVLRAFPYFPAMAALLLFSALSALLSALVAKSYKIKSEYSASDRPTTPGPGFLSLLKRKDFSTFILPNFIRGCAMGVFSMIAVIGVKAINLDEVTVSNLAVASAVANLAGCVFYLAVASRVKTAAVCLLGGALVAATLPFTVLGGASAFAIIFTLSGVGRVLVDYSIPVLIYKFIPFEIAARYNTWRMLISTAGSALASTLVGFLATPQTALYILITAAVSQLAASALYFIFSRRFIERRTS